MPALTLPRMLPDDAAYAAARREMEEVLRDGPGAASGLRFDELARLVEDYEARRAGYDLPRMRAALAAWNAR